MVLRSQPRTTMKSKATVRLDFAKNNVALAAVVVWQSMVTAWNLYGVPVHSVKMDVSYVKTG